MYEVSLDDVKAFVAQSLPDEVIGEPMQIESCLVAYTLAWKYPGCRPAMVGCNTQARIYGTWIELPAAIKQIADKFDSLGIRTNRSTVTRTELVRYMPGLVIY